MSTTLPKILITGAGGMLASEIISQLANTVNYTVIKAGHNDIDITDSKKVMDAISEIKPAIIINCAAFTNVEACEEFEFQETAINVNANGPKNLAIAACANNARLIHISTDYIFNKLTTTPITEEEPANPCNFYGKTKAKAEENILNNTKDALIIRTSWLYGHGGKNFIDTIIKKALASTDDLLVIDDQIGRPTYVADLASMIISLLHYQETKIINAANSKKCSWFELAKTALEYYGIKHNIKPVASENFKTKAVRPKYSVLSLATLREKAAINPRSWNEALKEYIAKEKSTKGVLSCP